MGFEGFFIKSNQYFLQIFNEINEIIQQISDDSELFVGHNHIENELQNELHSWLQFCFNRNVLETCTQCVQQKTQLQTNYTKNRYRSITIAALVLMPYL
jgi:hypothetical protein